MWYEAYMEDLYKHGLENPKNNNLKRKDGIDGIEGRIEPNLKESDEPSNVEDILRRDFGITEEDLIELGFSKDQINGIYENPEDLEADTEISKVLKEDFGVTYDELSKHFTDEEIKRFNKPQRELTEQNQVERVVPRKEKTNINPYKDIENIEPTVETGLERETENSLNNVPNQKQNENATSINNINDNIDASLDSFNVLLELIGIGAGIDDAMESVLLPSLKDSIAQAKNLGMDQDVKNKILKDYGNAIENSSLSAEQKAAMFSYFEDLTKSKHL